MHVVFALISHLSEVGLKIVFDLQIFDPFKSLFKIPGRKFNVLGDEQSKSQLVSLGLGPFSSFLVNKCIKHCLQIVSFGAFVKASDSS